MKKILLVALTMISTTGFTFTMAQLAGKYDVTSKSIPVVNVITIGKTGSFKLVEKTFEGSITCKGQATLIADVLSSHVKCPNGSEYDERIDLKGVKNLKSFSANVFSSLYNQEVKMDFVKIK